MRRIRSQTLSCTERERSQKENVSCGGRHEKADPLLTVGFAQLQLVAPQSGHGYPSGHRVVGVHTGAADVRPLIVRFVGSIGLGGLSGTTLSFNTQVRFSAYHVHATQVDSAEQLPQHCPVLVFVIGIPI